MSLWGTLIEGAGAGLLAMVHPCPLATTLAGVSFLVGWGSSVARSLALAGCFALGMAAAYLALGATAVWGLSSLPLLADRLPQAINLLLGPLFILVGMGQAGLLRAEAAAPRRLAVAATLRRLGLPGAAVFGAVLACAFCPSTAGLFFGVMLPLALHHDLPLLLPLAYALGVAAAVLGAAVPVAIGLAQGRQRQTTSRLVAWMPRLTGGALIALGLYLTIKRLILA